MTDRPTVPESQLTIAERMGKKIAERCNVSQAEGVDCAYHLLAVIDKAEWQIVPKEPILDMIHAADGRALGKLVEEFTQRFHLLRSVIWPAMLEAAPKPGVMSLVPKA